MNQHDLDRFLSEGNLYELQEKPSGYSLGALIMSFTLGAVIMGAIWQYTAKPSDLASTKYGGT